jgi:hypothetical protein
VYCSCPNDVTAAQVAKHLVSHGFHRARPLLGGLDAWKAEFGADQPLLAAPAIALPRTDGARPPCCSSNTSALAAAAPPFRLMNSTRAPSAGIFLPRRVASGNSYAG